MEKEIEEAIKDYQCAGCISGPSLTCFEKSEIGGIGCKKHYSGTNIMPGIGKIFLGMPKGFDRLGHQKDMKVTIFKTQEQQEEEWEYDEYNIAIWKHQNEKNHIFIRGYMPRLNLGFIHVILNGNYEEYQGKEIDITKID